MLHLSRKEFEEDFKPVDPDCVCHTCQTYTRAYIHSVLNQVNVFDVGLLVRMGIWLVVIYKEGLIKARALLKSS